MRLFRPVFVLATVFLAGLLFSACEEDGRGSNGALRVEVGVVQSLSGPGSVYGRSVLQGVELAVGEINEAEGGVRMTIALSDDNSDVEAGTQAFETLSTRGVTAIIGPTLSNVGLEAMPVAQEAGVPVLGATTTAQGITEIGDYIFRVALTEAVVVPATIARVRQDWDILSNVLVFDSTDAFSRSSAEAMRQGIGDIGASMLVEVDVSQTPIQDRLGELQGQPLNAFLITPLMDQSVEIVRAIREGGFQQIIIGGNSFNTPGMAEAGGALEGAYVGAAWNPSLDTPASTRFVEAFRERFESEPDLFAAQGYSSVYLLLDAVRRAGTTEATAVRQALASTAGVETPLGEVTMSSKREVVHDPVVQRFEGGHLVVLPDGAQ